MGTTGELEAVEKALRGWRYRWTSEYDLQDQVCAALDVAEIAHQREVKIGGDRFDFLAGRVCVEVKIAGSPAQLAGQLRRYARCDLIDSFVVVSSRSAHVKIPTDFAGKPVRVVSCATSGL